MTNLPTKKMKFDYRSVKVTTKIDYKDVGKGLSLSGWRFKFDGHKFGLDVKTEKPISFEKLELLKRNAEETIDLLIQRKGEYEQKGKTLNDYLISCEEI